MAFSPRELKVVTAGDDSEVRVWDLTKKACVATLKVSLLQCLWAEGAALVAYRGRRCLPCVYLGPSCIR